LLLVIDIGNSHTVLGLFEGGCGSSGAGLRETKRLSQTWRISTHPIGTADEFYSRLKLALETSPFRLENVNAIVIASVVPVLTSVALEAFKMGLPQIPVHVIDHQYPFSFVISAQPRNQIGIDRLVNAEAAVKDYGFPCIIVDAGTATTICAINRDQTGQADFLGGAIMPGLKLSMEALAKNAAQLFRVELTPPPRAIGTHTQDAIRSGLVFGYASMIDGIVRRFKAEMGISEIKVLATGGISPLMKDISQEITHFDSDLTLKGIAYFYDTLSC
jgi:type III pantothenate kinase